jgi:16S rRNA (adenine1518-N6/adenine1519-N6)-dimethyltransferase
VLDLTDPGSLKAFLGRHGLSADKRLGQHFLCSSRVVGAIAERLSHCKGIFEIGPGPGVLTAALSATSERMVAIELDERMIGALAESAPAVDVRKEDALKANYEAILHELPAPRALVSNLPYYITGPLLTRIAEARAHYDVAILMMQKEVAERVLAGPKTSERGSLSVYLQSQFEIQKVAAAPAGAFLPPPKVDSTVLQFKPTTGTPSLEFFKLVRLGFAQPRKTLANNLVSGFHIGRDQALRWILDSGLGELARPQELSLSEWFALEWTMKRGLQNSE